MEEFAKACGARGSLQLRVEKRGLAAQGWSTPQPFALIGRSPEADLSLDHPRVDLFHVYLQVIKGRVFWVDLGSRSGTQWENGPARSGWLNPVNGIGIGPHMVQLLSDDPVDDFSTNPRVDLGDPFSSSFQDSETLKHVVLEFRRDSFKPIRWRMRHALTLLGSSPLCKVRLSAPGVLPFHCSLLRTGAAVWLINLVGSAGATLNGFKVTASRLLNGDEFEIGEISIRVLIQADASTKNDRGSNEIAQLGRGTVLVEPATISREVAKSHSQDGWNAPFPEVSSRLAESLSCNSEPTAPSLSMIINHFQEMQQQLFLEFQHTSIMMLQALGATHRDQMEALQEKLDSLSELTESVKFLKDHIMNPNERQVISPEVAKGLENRTSPDKQNDYTQVKKRVMPDGSNTQSLNVHEWLVGRFAAMESEQRTGWQKVIDLMLQR